jgi:alkanesulfonate monooxygenase SsuD/methylene tetrahydromethanopterin reductase-like flavin-dependent oxidoreductase (luciferase family)
MSPDAGMERAMQFAAFFLAGSPSREDPETVFRRMARFAQDADELGYDSIWFAEHHFSNYGYIPNPLLVATRLAAETSRLRLGTAVLVLPFWHPLRVAEDIALTDQLTGGRLEVGVARGYQPFEFRRFGLDFADARERTDETLEILLRALTQDSVTYEGAHYQIPETTIFPRPLQQPHPPLWLAAHTRESFEIGARLGLRALTTNSGRPLSELETGWVNHRAARERYPDAPPDFGVQTQVCVAPTDDEARAQMPHFLYQSRQATNLRAGREHVVSGVSEPLPYEGEPDLDEMFESRTLAGTPDTVAAKLSRYLEVCEMTQLNCVFYAGEMPAEVSRRSMRLFAEEVMPRFR